MASWVGKVIDMVKTATATSKSDDDLKKLVLQAILEHESALGIQCLRTLEYQFRPYDANNTALIDSAAWENAVNITVNESLKLTDPASAGRIETKSILLDKELAFVKVRLNKKGATTYALLTMDISGDKTAVVQDGNMGTWFVADAVLSSLAVDSLIDTSGLVCRTFSLKLTLAPGVLELTDMVIELYQIPSKLIGEHLLKLRDSVCAIIYEQLFLKAVQNGNDPQTIAAMERMMKVYQAKGLGVLLLGSGESGGRGASIASSSGSGMVATKSADPALSSERVEKRGIRKGDFICDVLEYSGHKVVVFDTRGNVW